MKRYIRQHSPLSRWVVDLSVSVDGFVLMHCYLISLMTAAYVYTRMIKPILKDLSLSVDGFVLHCYLISLMAAAYVRIGMVIWVFES